MALDTRSLDILAQRRSQPSLVEIDTAAIALEMAECVVDVVSSLSGERIGSLQSSASDSILQVKRRIAAMRGTSRFCQSLFLPSADSPLADDTSLASLASTGAETPSACAIKLLLVVHAWIVDDDDASRRLQGLVDEMLRKRTSPDAADADANGNHDDAQK